jgi:hypothetical protein
MTSMLSMFLNQLWVVGIIDWPGFGTGFGVISRLQWTQAVLCSDHRRLLA